LRGLRPRIEAIVDRMLETMRHVTATDVRREVRRPFAGVRCGGHGMREATHNSSFTGERGRDVLGEPESNLGADPPRIGGSPGA